jgi:hypothetical protein
VCFTKSLFVVTVILLSFFSDNSRLPCFKGCFYRCICFTAICIIFILIIKSFYVTLTLAQKKKKKLPQQQEEPRHVCGKHPGLVLKSVTFNSVDSHQSARFLIQTSVTGFTDGALPDPCRQASEFNCYIFHIIC